MVQHAPDIVTLLDSEGTILHGNSSIERVLGYDPGELVGENALGYIHPEDRERVSGVFARVVRDGDDIRTPLPYRCINKYGWWVHLEATGSNRLDDPGVGAVVISSRDVTERAEAERGLGEREEWLHLLMEQAADAIFVHDLEGRVTDVNRRACASLGYSREELLDMSVPDIEVNYVAGSIHRLWERMMDGDYITVEGVHRRKDGITFPVEARVGLLTSGEGQRFLAICRDTTERKRAEEELKQQYTAIEGAMDGIAVIDGEGAYTYMNQAHASVYGYDSPEELVGQSWRIHYDEEQVKTSDRQALPALRESGYWRGESTGTRKDGSTFPQELSLTALEDGGAVCVVRDITERKQKEKHVEELLARLVSAQEEERGWLAYEIHDEITQLASAAHLRLQTFARRHPPATGDEGRELEAIRELVGETVSVTRRLIADLRPPALEDIGLAPAVRQCVEELQGGEREVVYEEDLGERRLPHSVEITLFRVAQEALANVGRHTSSRSPVCVELRLGEEEVKLEVSDRGEGFDPARQANGGPGEKVGIFGMRERVSLAGGSFELESRPGEGTRLSARVPLLPYRGVFDE